MRSEFKFVCSLVIYTNVWREISALKLTQADKKVIANKKQNVAYEVHELHIRRVFKQIARQVDQTISFQVDFLKLRELFQVFRCNCLQTRFLIPPEPFDVRKGASNVPCNFCRTYLSCRKTKNIVVSFPIIMSAFNTCKLVVIITRRKNFTSVNFSRIQPSPNGMISTIKFNCQTEKDVDGQQDQKCGQSFPNYEIVIRLIILRTKLFSHVSLEARHKVLIQIVRSLFLLILMRWFTAGQWLSL